MNTITVLEIHFKFGGFFSQKTTEDWLMDQALLQYERAP